MKQYLGIETSCDECSASIVSVESGQFRVRHLTTFSQTKIHEPYGGVVPEISSRNHLETINAVIDETLLHAKVSPQDLAAVCVTNRPGLVGSLLVGVSAAKAFAYATRLSVVPVHHLEGHAASVFLDQPEVSQKIKFPCLLAMVSGGHTNLYVIREPWGKWPEEFLKSSLVGRSRDDAAGEAFDKTAKLLGLPYPGGQLIDLKSAGGNEAAFNLPRALPDRDVLDYSFSGLKTAVSLVVKDLRQKGELESRLTDLCASIQAAITDALMAKFKLAYSRFRCESVVLVGGVAANRRLRSMIEKEFGDRFFLPRPQYCTDNAAMIAAAGSFRYEQGIFLTPSQHLTLNARAHAEF